MTDSNGTPVFGVTVTFTVVPNAGTSGTFPGNATSAMATTNINGQATAPTLTANTTGGTFTVNATVSGVGSPAVFNLTVCAIVCPSNIVKSTDTDQCSAVTMYNTPTTAAGCGTVMCTPPSGTAFPKGTTTVTCTLTPGNVSCTFTVTVNDTQAPAITCPANITKATDLNQCSAVTTYPAPTVSDNCPNVGTPVCSPPSGIAFQKGVTTVTCMVSDASSNSKSCTFTVTVNDTQAPSITCPANITKANDLNQCGAVVTYSAPSVSDNCPNVGAPSCSPPSGSFFPKGTTTVTCMVSDASANSKSCAFTVTVNDTQAPTITCPANITKFLPAQCPLNTTGTSVSFAAPVATDNCSGVTVVCAPPSGANFPIGTTTVTCTATDTSGNHTSCSFRVKVFDVGIQDDTNANTVFLFNSYTGEYVLCFNGQKYTGTGSVTKRGCTISLTDNTTYRVNMTVDMSTKKGNGTVQSPPGTVLCTITDKDMANDACNCSYPN